MLSSAANTVILYDLCLSHYTLPWFSELSNMLNCNHLLSLPAAKPLLGQGLLFICFRVGCIFLLQKTSSDLLVSKCLI